MGVVYFVFYALGKCLDVLCFVLDLNFWIASSLVRLLSSVVSFLNSMPSLLSSSAAECWNLALVCMLAAAGGLMSVAQSSLHALGGWLQALGGVPESFKMAGHLSSHVLLRARELLQRGLLSAHSVLRQACEGCSIAFSLALYLVNTVVNMLLIGTQNCLAAVASMWEVVSSPLQKALELALTVLTFLYSSLVAVSVLLWTPCQLALDFLGSLGHVFVTVFLLNLYGLFLTAAVVLAITAIYLNPQLLQRGAQGALHCITTVPALHRLQRVLYRLYLLALERAQTALEMGVWQRAALPGSQTGQDRGRGTAEDGEGDGNRVGPQPEGALEQRPAGSPGTRTQLAPEHTGQERGGTDPPRQPPATLCSGADTPLQKLPPTDSLLTLLKEHEERKKCVICQDSLKTVLLLPCRHLCLCRDCADILKRQPPHQHSCPLCRQAIAHTMDVYL
ncbi:E3 ubiquitin-protein ligase RNF26-like [Megalops cyprinoides]|uniref:E3 ubiquitin-protein ligase RNF26-like n=1 Tax=Megalops cyprinoides TaxID=118141 RepID=UPI001863DF7E|nr:E3 ubiquitin-protein ligase RNF26-like [Megalops cyprinoides]